MSLSFFCVLVWVLLVPRGKFSLGRLSRLVPMPLFVSGASQLSWGLEKKSDCCDSSVVQLFRMLFPFVFFFPRVFPLRSVGLLCGYWTFRFSWLAMESRFRFAVKFKSRVDCRRSVFLVVPKTVSRGNRKEVFAIAEADSPWCVESKFEKKTSFFLTQKTCFF